MCVCEIFFCLYDFSFSLLEYPFFLLLVNEFSTAADELCLGMKSGSFINDEAS